MNKSKHNLIPSWIVNLKMRDSPVEVITCTVFAHSAPEALGAVLMYADQRVIGSIANVVEYDVARTPDLDGEVLSPESSLPSIETTSVFERIPVNESAKMKEEARSYGLVPASELQSSVKLRRYNIQFKYCSHPGKDPEFVSVPVFLSSIEECNSIAQQLVDLMRVRHFSKEDDEEISKINLGSEHARTIMEAMLLVLMEQELVPYPTGVPGAILLARKYSEAAAMLWEWIDSIKSVHPWAEHFSNLFRKHK